MIVHGMLENHIIKEKKAVMIFQSALNLKDDATPYEDDQYIKLIELLECLKKEYNIQDVVGHSDIAPSRKTDPGPLFDWKKIK